MLAKFIDGNGLIYKTLTEYSEKEMPSLLHDGYVEISDEDYQLYATLNYVYNPLTRKPKYLQPTKQPLEELKADKLREIDKWTADKITSGFTSNCSGELVRYDSDKDTQLTMQGIAINVDSALFAEKYPNGCPVRGYAEGETVKSVFMLTPEQVKQWQADLSIHIGTCKQNGWAKQAQVEDAQSESDLSVIVLE